MLILIICLVFSGLTVLLYCTIFEESWWLLNIIIIHILSFLYINILLCVALRVCYIIMADEKKKNTATAALKDASECIYPVRFIFDKFKKF